MHHVSPARRSTWRRDMEGGKHERIHTLNLKITTFQHQEFMRKPLLLINACMLPSALILLSCLMFFGTAEAK
jgi:hypothetical protein